MIPTDLLALEQKQIYKRKADIEKAYAQKETRTDYYGSVSEKTDKWHEGNLDRQAHKAISYVDWLQRQRDKLFSTQFLTEHSLFRTCLYKILKVDKPDNIFCRQEIHLSLIHI